MKKIYCKTGHEMETKDSAGGREARCVACEIEWAPIYVHLKSGLAQWTSSGDLNQTLPPKTASYVSKGPEGRQKRRVKRVGTFVS